MRRGFYFFLISIFLFSNISFVSAQDDHLLISEIQIAGESSTDEFIEIYNPTANVINLSGYRLSKKTSSGSESNLLTAFADFDLQSNSYYLIVHPSGYTGETEGNAVYSTSQSVAGDNTVVLYSDAGNTIVDKVGMGSAGDFEGVVITPNPEAGKSMGRAWIDGYIDTNNNANDFEIQNPTPGAQNKTYTEPEEPEEPIIYSDKIYINEFLPAPGTSTDWDGDGEANSSDEWIELINLDDVAINLEGWTLDDIEEGGSSAYIIPSVVIEPDDFLVFYKSSTGLALNNTGDSVILKNPDGDIVDQYSYTSTGTDESWARIGNDPGEWTDDYSPSPGFLNEPPDNQHPVASAGSDINNAIAGQVVNFNGSSSYDPDGDIVLYYWSFGDGGIALGQSATHSYGAKGSYQVVLKVTDSNNASSSDYLVVTVIEESVSQDDQDDSYQNQYSDNIKIIEFLPNPEGSDNDDEYIKLFNFGLSDINLRNWTLDDEDGGSKIFIIDSDNIIKSNSSCIFYRTETKLAINNTGDEIRIFDPDGELIDSISFNESAPEGEAYILENSKWRWEGEEEFSNSVEDEEEIDTPEEVIEGQEVEENIIVSIPQQKITDEEIKNIIPRPIIVEEPEEVLVSSYRPVIVVEAGLPVKLVSAEINKKETETLPLFLDNISSPNKKWPLSPYFIIPIMLFVIAGIIKFIVLPENLYKFLDNLIKDKENTESITKLFDSNR